MTAHPPASRDSAARPSLDELWADMLLDACASDGPIRDADVREAMKRGRPKIEAEARADERRRVVEQVRAEVHDYMEAASLVSDSGLTIDRDDFDTILDAALSGPADPTEDGS